MSQNRIPNHLAGQTSPYLRAHAYNPVDWHPWGDEAFEKAKRENKMIFLSIGYHTCHWCHVMEKESFEDDTVAAILNRHFVSIKVDREERPDLDAVYMQACQVLTGSGGWPLNLWLTPDRKPVYAGTYFPRDNHPQRPGLLAVLEQLAMLWQKDTERVLEQGEQLVAVLNRRSMKSGPVVPGLAKQALAAFEKAFDRQYGGFGKAPKFPSPSQTSFLLAYWRRTGEKAALHMAERTLDAMAAGGIWDHVGGGFHRYSVDSRWLVPHFEKMLYDNAQMLDLYAKAWDLTGKQRFRHMADRIYHFMATELLDHEKGVFFSAYDADSEGREGTYYLWDRDEVVSVLGEDRGAAFCKAYGFKEGGNFEGRQIPNRIHVFQKEGVWESGFVKELALLKDARSKRVKPNLDDKTLMTGNSLAAMALYRYGRAAGCSEALEMADRVLAYLSGEGFKPVVLEDEAYLAAALLERHQTTQEPEMLISARNLVEAVHDSYWDPEGKGYFLTAKDHEELIARPKEVYDNAMPSGNSVMAMTLFKLFLLLDDPVCHQRFLELKKAFADEAAKAPLYCSAFLEAWLEEEEGAGCMAVALPDQTSQPAEPSTAAMETPLVVLHLRPGSKLYQAYPVLEAKRPVDGRTTYYRCSGFACQPPSFEWQ